jgi:hypothetical protein
MMRLHDILDARRKELGWTYEDVHERLLAYAWPPGVKPPGLPTVGHWFNGTRRPRNMQHLAALTAVLELSLDAAVKGAPAEAKTAEEQVLLDLFRGMTDVDRQMWLIMGKRLEKGG